MSWQTIATCLSALAAIAAAVAAWMSWLTSCRALDYSKRFTKNRDAILQLNSTLAKLKSLDGLFSNIPGLSGDEFARIDPLFQECQRGVRDLALNGVMEFGDSSAFSTFQSCSFAEMVAGLDRTDSPLNMEIKAVQQRLNELLA